MLRAMLRVTEEIFVAWSDDDRRQRDVEVDGDGRWNPRDLVISRQLR